MNKHTLRKKAGAAMGHCGRLLAMVLISGCMLDASVVAGAEPLKDEAIARKYGFVEIDYRRIPDAAIQRGSHEESDTWGSGFIAITVHDMTEGPDGSAMQYTWIEPRLNDRYPTLRVTGEKRDFGIPVSMFWCWDDVEGRAVKYLEKKYISLAFLEADRKESQTGRVVFDIPRFYRYRPFDGLGCRILLPTGKYRLSFMLRSLRYPHTMFSFNDNDVYIVVDAGVHYQVDLVFGPREKSTVKMFKVNASRVEGLVEPRH